MKLTKNDDHIFSVLQQKANCYPLPDDLKSRIHTKIEQSNREVTYMKRINIKRTAAIVVLAAALTGTVCYAAANNLQIFTSSSASPDYTHYEDLGKAEKKANVSSNALSSFSNGFQFKGITIDKQETKLGKDTDRYKCLSIEYSNGTDDIDYIVTPRMMNQDVPASHIDQTFEQDGNTYYYQEVENKFVPEDYQPTEEELAAVADCSLNIGYGDDEIHTCTGMTLWWYDTDAQVTYQLFGFDLSLSPEELYQMALELGV